MLHLPARLLLWMVFTVHFRWLLPCPGTAPRPHLHLSKGQWTEGQLVAAFKPRGSLSQAHCFSE